MIQQSYLEYLQKNYPQHLEYYISRKKISRYIVNEFSTSSEDDYKKYILQKDTICKSFLEQYICICKRDSSNALFNKLEIETINQCNNTCSFCPVNVFKDRRIHRQMTMELFENIISQLVSLNYKGIINLFSNNEPLLDTLLLDRLKVARERLPSAYISIYTNGLLMTPEKLMELLPYVNFIHINNYNTEPVLLPTHLKLQQALIKNHVPKERVEIHLRNKSECLSSRAGNSPNRDNIVELYSPCILPFSQMVIRPNGQVSFCCNDAYGEYTMGDVSYESLSDIWYGKHFNKSRENMLKGRSCQSPCKNCDMLFMPLAYETN
ncbi:MAG: SPASM domain-containing protein [bacterium]|nr:SPASM domain-containing protein [bacterium]